MRARWGTAAAAAITAALVMVPAAPAAAATASVNIYGPSDGSTTTSTSVPITGRAQIDRDLLGGNNINGLAITVAVGGRNAASCDGAGCGAGYGSYTTAFSYTPVLTSNGYYKITVDVSAVDYVPLSSPVTRTARAVTSVRVAVPPAPPHGVTAHANTDRSVTVSWNRNTEPDIFGYQIQRIDPDGSTSAVLPFLAQSASSSLSWTDLQPAQTGGHYSYVVFVFRPDGDGGKTHPMSAASRIASVSVPLPPAPPPPPDSTTAPAGAVTGATTTTPAPHAPTVDLSGFLAQANAAGATTPKIVVPTPHVSSSGIGSSAPPTLPDPGFSANLPFGARPPALQGANGGPPEVGLGRAVSPAPAGSGQRTLLLPIATGLLLCAFGFHLRFLSRRPSSEWMEPLAPVLDFISRARDKLPGREDTPE